MTCVPMAVQVQGSLSLGVQNIVSLCSIVVLYLVQTLAVWFSHWHCAVMFSFKKMMTQARRAKSTIAASSN